MHNLFVDGRSGTQPTSPTAQDVQLNAGAVQLRLRRAALQPGQSPSAQCLDGADMYVCLGIRGWSQMITIGGDRFVGGR